MRLSIILLSTLALSGCGSLMNLFPDQFDNMEYAKLVELNVAASIHKNGITCQRPDETYRTAKFLEVYSKGTMNETNQNIYVEIGSLVTELYQRNDPSPAYCKVKWGNIEKATSEVITLSGARIKK